jgi:hypothetical protein
MSPVDARLALLVFALVGAVGSSLFACGNDSTKPVGGGRPRAPEAETLRGCRTAVYGDIDPKARREATVAGPLELLAASDASRPARAFEPAGVAKVLAVLRAGETVTLSVPESERGRLSLLYDLSGPGPRRPPRLSDGVSAVRFKACAKGIVAGTRVKGASESQFNGGFFVRGAHCAPIEVWVEGREGPLRRQLPFGTGGRPCPADRGSRTP